VDEAEALRLGGAELERAAAAAGVRLRVLPDRDALYEHFATAMLGEVLAAAEANRPCRLIVPVGPRGQYGPFVKRCNAGRIDLRRLHLFAMDEYLDWQGRYIPDTDPLSFRGFLRRALTCALDPACGFSEGRLLFPDPLDLDAYSRRIAEVGGIDCCFGGIGIHGHVAFNEPPRGFAAVGAEAFAASLSRVVALAPETVVMNSIRGNGGDLARFPPMAVTAGMRDILAARRIRLYCDGGAWQRSVLRRAVFGARGADWPVTLLRGHPDFEIACDGETAAAIP
jgi:glucosamine-6-phosphate deaminase